MTVELPTALEYSNILYELFDQLVAPQLPAAYPSSPLFAMNVRTRFYRRLAHDICIRSLAPVPTPEDTVTAYLKALETLGFMLV